MYSESKQVVGSPSPIPGISKEKFQILCLKAVQAKENSYCPYSQFPVGCALLTEDNKIYTGVNVENASYGGAICAERTAIVKAVSEGHKKIKALAVSTNSSKCSSPCGICRQVIREFSEADLKLPIIMLDKNGKKYIEMTIDELLPLSFGPDDLEK